jgi:hypothetical protein
MERYKKYKSKICITCGETFGSNGNPKYCYECKDKMFIQRRKIALEKYKTMKLTEEGL